ncbi:MAG: EAL domain-containing protein [Xenococcaceae cyanobacterium MO_188.B29]|nr:EAL domain-containing protein [Xenococcaceae cyanobacterium MO_188.B29]
MNLSKNSQQQLHLELSEALTLKFSRELEIFLNLSSELFCVIGVDGYLKQFNSSFLQILGYSTKELLTKPFLSFVHEEDRQKTFTKIEQLNNITSVVHWENRYLCQDGSCKWLEWKAKLDTTNRLIYACARDLTQSRQLERQLFLQTKHDALTGLYNRKEFEVQVTEAIFNSQENGSQHALCYLDLDQFKVVNDTCGHVGGDNLLRQLTILKKKLIRSSDVLARLGGDEFGLLLKQCSLEQAETIANTIRTLIQEFRFSWEDKVFTLSASIGLVSIDQNSQNFSSVLSAADAACYAAKEKGRNRVFVYRHNDRELTRQRKERQWVAHINRALEEDRFCLYCQKIISLKENDSREHYEILLRLLDKDGKLVPPMAFIPAAENYNLMPAIDRWVISTFFSAYNNYCQRKNQTTNNLKSANFPEEKIYTINLSGASINSDSFFDFLKEQFTLYPISPSTICFEITETSAIANLAKAAEFIDELKQLGCLFALDDFGSGMSSLAYLKNLPVDFLKIDGSFVKNILDDPVDHATVDCFNRIGHVMNMQTIAEFVENEPIIQKLRKLGVDYAQGYGIDKPKPLSFDVE